MPPSSLEADLSAGGHFKYFSHSDLCCKTVLILKCVLNFMHLFYLFGIFSSIIAPNSF